MLSRRFVGRRQGGLVSILVAGMLAAAGPTSARAAEYEQYNRADGVAGSAPIGLGQNSTYNAVVSGDGRNAYFTFGDGQGEWASAAGLYRRDLLTNRTIRIVAGVDARISGLTTDNALVSFTTVAKLSAADTNGKPDLYGYTVATGKIDLLSRADGVNGAALGITGAAFVTRNGKVALFSTSLGLGRRDLASGRTVKIADTGLGDGTVPYWRSDSMASADGSVYVTGGALVSPRGKVALAPTGVIFGGEVNEAGTWATWNGYVGGAYVGGVVNVATGARSALPVTDPDTEQTRGFDATASGYRIVRFAGGESELIRYDFATGKRTSTGWRAYGFDSISANGKYAISNVGGPPTTGYVTAAPGNTIPGGTDLPSAQPYVTFAKGCARSTLVQFRPSRVGAQFTMPIAPKAASVNLKTYNTAGALIGQLTFTANGEVNVPSLLAAFKLVATVKLVDGRTITGTWNLPYIGSNERCSL